MERVTVTLPADLVRSIDQREKNRSRFVAEAIQREIDRRQREELRYSLDNPHPETKVVGADGTAEWARTLPDEDELGLVNRTAGKAVRWVPGKGWKEGKR